MFAWYLWVRVHHFPPGSDIAGIAYKKGGIEIKKLNEYLRTYIYSVLMRGLQPHYQRRNL